MPAQPPFPRLQPRTAWWLILAMAFTTPVHALDLRQAYEAALAQDATIRSARAGAEATRERLPQALAQQRPQVALNATRHDNDLTSQSPGPGNSTVRRKNDYYSSSQTLSVRQPLYRPYLGALVRQARAQVEEADALLERDEQALVVRVGEAYFDVLLAQDQVALQRAQKASHALQLDIARKNFAAGAGTRTDIDEVQARLHLTLAQELEVLQHVEFTQRRLEMLIGQGATTLAGLDMARFTPCRHSPRALRTGLRAPKRPAPNCKLCVPKARPPGKRCSRPRPAIARPWRRWPSGRATRAIA